jgi:hypothetical protein
VVSSDDVGRPDPTGRRVPTNDDVATRLEALVARMRDRYGDDVVTRRPLEEVAGVSTRLGPLGTGTCPVTWIEMSDSELILTVAVIGRWELPRNLDAVKQIEDTVDAVAAGRVVQRHRWGRHSTVVTFSDGRSEISTYYRGLGFSFREWRGDGGGVTYRPWDARPSH